MKWFHFVDVNDDDVYININHITSIKGKEVYVLGNEYTRFKYTLTHEEVDALIKGITHT